MTASPFTEKHFKSIVFAIWLAQAALLLFTAWDFILQWKMGDPDDQLRLVQVRDWIAGQSWWDLTQYRMNAPDGGPMHWSRLVDIPIAGLIVLLTPFFGQQLAEHTTVVVLPLLTLGIVVYLIASITRVLFGAKAALVAAASIVLMLPVTVQLVPMRIDHHGWQLVMFLLGVKYLFNRRAPAKSAVIVGMAMATWMEISIEGLPFAILFMGLFALRWVTAEENRETQFAWAMASLATTSALFFISTEQLRLAGNDCDELSVFHIAGFAASAAVVVAGTWAARMVPSSKLLMFKLAAGGIAGAAALAAVFTIAPQCAGDSFAGLDPLVRQYWFDRVLEGLPLLQQRSVWVAQELGGLFFGLLGIIALFMRTSTMSNHDRITIALLFFGCAAVGFQVARAAVYALCLSVTLLAPVIVGLFERSEKVGNIWRRNGVRLLACALAMPGAVGANASAFIGKLDAPLPVAKVAREARLMDLARICQSEKHISPLRRLPSSQLMAGLDVSPAILQFTQHKVVATGHHRNQFAMRDVILAFTEQPEIVRQIYAKRGIEYLISCAGSLELLMYKKNSPTGLWSRLADGERFDWLEPQPDIGPYRVWRVRMDKSVPRSQSKIADSSTFAL